MNRSLDCGLFEGQTVPYLSPKSKTRIVESYKSEMGSILLLLRPVTIKSLLESFANHNYYN